jgi:hypothetical protein
MADSKLNDKVKLFIIRALACYDTPSVVVDAVREEFGITLQRQSVERYDPLKYAGRDLAAKWKTEFEAARKDFKEKTADIPIANRAFRLRALNRMAQKAESMRNLPLAAQLFEQAAKEVGDVYTNKQKIDAKVQATARTVVVPAKAAK